MAETIVQVENLNLFYKSLHAVHNVTFTLKAGEILAIIGQNGSGKTSSVECIEGLRKPSSGVIKVFGQDPWLHRSTIYKKMGVQLQEAEYFSKIKVAELCELFASFYEKSADWTLLLKQLGLYEKRKRYVNKLSGGEKQRLAILLSLIGRPRLLVLDELTTGLDPEVRANLWTGLNAIKSSGVAMIMVSHYLDEVEALADKMLYLEKGKQLFYGTKLEFREYVKMRIPRDQWADNLTLEQLYLRIAPKTAGLTMEGLL